MSIWQYFNFSFRDGDISLWLGFILGTQLIMLVHSFFLFCTSRDKDRAQLYFILALVSVSLLMLELLAGASNSPARGLRSFALLFLWSTGLTLHLLHSLLVATIAGRGKLARGIKYFLGGLLALALSTFWTPAIVDQIALLGITSVAAIDFYVILYAQRQGIQKLGFILSGFALFLIGCALLLATQTNLSFQGGDFSLLAAVTFFLMTSILSLAFIDSINQERNAKEMAHKALLEVQKKINFTLENTVAKRTQELESANEKLKIISEVDGLTGVKNRRFFDHHAEQIYSSASRSNSPLSLIMVDLDEFKDVNDKFGHQVGDLCLQSAATLMQLVVTREADIVTRYGGEEFAILLPSTDADGAMAIAEQIRQRLEATPIDIHRRSIRLTASMGVVSETPSHHCKVEKFIARADKALYLAKNRGRNRVLIWQEIMSSESARAAEVVKPVTTWEATNAIKLAKSRK